jgi:enamine deaminase RidA (YjgF/YER057c/UK114 family)
MDPIEQAIHDLGLKLPPPPAVQGNYLPFRRSGNLFFLAGALPMAEGQAMTGKVGDTHSIEDGYIAARQCALNNLAVVKLALGSLDRLGQILTVTGFVNAEPDFTAVPEVINGASDLFVALYGDAGKHARAAVGVATLPKGALVEVQITFEAKI